MTKFSFLYVEEKKVHLAGLIFIQFLGNLSGSQKIQALFIFNNTMKKLHILIFIHTLLQSKIKCIDIDSEQNNSEKLFKGSGNFCTSSC